MDKISRKTSQFSVEVGARIAERRKQLKLTQEQAAEMANVSHQFFACVERGAKNMRAENIVKVSKALDISTDYILLGAPNEHDNKRLDLLLEPFTPKEMRCMEEIIKNFLIISGHNGDDD